MNKSKAYKGQTCKIQAQNVKRIRRRVAHAKMQIMATVLSNAADLIDLANIFRVCVCVGCVCAVKTARCTNGMVHDATIRTFMTN